MAQLCEETLKNFSSIKKEFLARICKVEEEMKNHFQSKKNTFQSNDNLGFHAVITD